MEEDFNPSPEDIAEFRKKTQEIVQENNRKRIEERFGDSTKYFEKLGIALNELGVFYDFDVAHDRVFFTIPKHYANDMMSFEDLARFYKEKIDPIAFASAIKAGMIAPRFFRFWGSEEDDY
jgi:hypothetical protein